MKEREEDIFLFDCEVRGCEYFLETLYRQSHNSGVERGVDLQEFVDLLSSETYSALYECGVVETKTEDDKLDAVLDCEEVLEDELLEEEDTTCYF